MLILEGDESNIMEIAKLPRSSLPFLSWQGSELNITCRIRKLR